VVSGAHGVHAVGAHQTLGGFKRVAQCLAEFRGARERRSWRATSGALSQAVISGTTAAMTVTRPCATSANTSSAPVPCPSTTVPPK
jgi:hypothetical protein